MVLAVIIATSVLKIIMDPLANPVIAMAMAIAMMAKAVMVNVNVTSVLPVNTASCALTAILAKIANPVIVTVAENATKGKKEMVSAIVIMDMAAMKAIAKIVLKASTDPIARNVHADPEHAMTAFITMEHVTAKLVLKIMR